MRPLWAAALALPGILPAAAVAQSVPDQGIFTLSYLDYRDWQPGADRMTVRSPSFYVLAPFAEKWTVQGSVVYDQMSGASPLWFNTLSGASGEGVHDYRTAGDVKVTRYYDRYAIGIGGAYSHERDYISRAASLDVRWWTADRNTTLAFGFGGSADYIHPTDRNLNDGNRETYDYLIGITQNLSPVDIVQSNVTYNDGRGYYSDPYKPLDTRPERRRILAWLTRYNHAFVEQNATLRLGYRFLNDSFGGTSNAFDIAWVQTLPQGWTLTPSYRYYTQGAADFYMNPPYPSGYVRGGYYSADTRLAAFGAMTFGLRADYDLTQGWSLYLSADYYRQDPSWRAFGEGSPGILTFSARWFAAGVNKTF
ncbi:MAG: DUF3570 domain-containing protein [Proteobacteria bacterium]|nr:DUF3570 domain-containing protein [Pseudomonadota bacterium]